MAMNDRQRLGWEIGMKLGLGSLGMELVMEILIRGDFSNKAVLEQFLERKTLSRDDEQALPAAVNYVREELGLYPELRSRGERFK